MKKAALSIWTRSWMQTYCFNLLSSQIWRICLTMVKRFSACNWEVAPLFSVLFHCCYVVAPLIEKFSWPKHILFRRNNFFVIVLQNIMYVMRNSRCVDIWENQKIWCIYCKTWARIQSCLWRLSRLILGTVILALCSLDLYEKQAQHLNYEFGILLKLPLWTARCT